MLCQKDLTNLSELIIPIGSAAAFHLVVLCGVEGL